MLSADAIRRILGVEDYTPLLHAKETLEPYATGDGAKGRPVSAIGMPSGWNRHQIGSGDRSRRIRAVEVDIRKCQSEGVTDAIVLA